MILHIFNINTDLSQITKEQTRDTGMAMVLILLICGFIFDNILYFKIAIPVLLLNMVFPLSYKFLAMIWLNFSTLLGTVVSRILLSIVFFLIVTPVGLIRRIFGFDSLRLKQFKSGNKSVFNYRNYHFKKDDIEKPF